MATNQAVEIGETWTGERVLNDETRARIKSAIRGLLTLKEPQDDLEELTEDLPLEVNQLNISYAPEYILEFDLFVDHPDGMTFVTDEPIDCPHHESGEPLSTLAELGEDYAALEKDLLEVICLMADLPEFPDDREEYVFGDFAFTNLFCYDGTLAFTFMCPVNYPARKMYQDGAFELGRKVGIPVDPSTDKIINTK
ncbi:hypothetical protein [Halosimplex sp. J119]